MIMLVTIKFMIIMVQVCLFIHWCMKLLSLSKPFFLNQLLHIPSIEKKFYLFVNLLKKMFCSNLTTLSFVWRISTLDNLSTQTNIGGLYAFSAGSSSFTSIKTMFVRENASFDTWQNKFSYPLNRLVKSIAYSSKVPVVEISLWSQSSILVIFFSLL